MLDGVNAGETWRRAIERIPGMTGDYAKKFHRLEISGMNRVTVFFSPEHAFCKTACQRPEQVLRFEQALKDVTGQPMPGRVQVVGGIATGRRRGDAGPAGGLAPSAAHGGSRPSACAAGERVVRRPTHPSGLKSTLRRVGWALAHRVTVEEE